MERRVAVVATLALAVALATVPTGGLAQSGSASIAPGERFAGVVGVQEIEIQGAVESRAFDARFERADGNASRARVIANQVNETRERLRELRERKERLREARENGSISEGRYQARMAQLIARSNALQQQLNRTEAASERVPDRALRERGVDPAELDRLRAAAGNLIGPEVAAIARNITGNGGQPAGVGPGEARGDRGPNAGPPGDAGNASRGGGSGSGDGASRGADGSGSGNASDAGGSGSGDGAGQADGSGSENAGDAGDAGDGSGNGNAGSDAGQAGGGSGSGNGDGSGADGSGDGSGQAGDGSGSGNAGSGGNGDGSSGR